jgi:hypothetical protein
MILVPLLNPKFAIAIGANFGFAALEVIREHADKAVPPLP